MTKGTPADVSGHGSSVAHLVANSQEGEVYSESMPASKRWSRRLWAVLLTFAITGYIIYAIPSLSLRLRKMFHRHRQDFVLPTPDETLYPSFPVDISSLFNNIAAGPRADFDPHSHGGYAAEFLPKSEFVHDRVKLILPETWGEGEKDNLIPNGEHVRLASPVFVREMHILYAGDWIDGESGAKFQFHFEDGSSEYVEVSVKNWWTLHWLNQGVIRTPYHNTPEGRNYNLTQIYHWSTAVRSFSPLSSITLPTASWPNHVHLFSLSLVPCEIPTSFTQDNRAFTTHIQPGQNILSMHNPKESPQSIAFTKPPMSIRRGIYTTKWTTMYGFKVYMVEVTVVNPLPGILALDEDMWARGRFFVGVNGAGIETARFGVFQRLMPSDEAKVKVWIVLSPGVQAESVGDAVISISDEQGNVLQSLQTSGAARSFVMDVSSIDTPEWWDDAKFGIFIHWGIYAVPGWAPPGWYAAWYYWWVHKWTNSDNGFWKYHRDTYGPDVVYDDFIGNFTASKFNASEWVHLFADAGAKYFVFVTKHHDGYALFDTKDTTHRSSWHLGPKRDFLKELFDTAKAETPELKRGTYITMPEWYNPDAGKGGYGFGDWPGDLPRNAFDDSKVEPYTGHIYGKDYLRDNQLEHMRMLAMNYETEIIWCDIGGPNLTKEFAKEWYPFAESQGRQVVMNNRCGDLPQFDTPEYTKFSSIQRTKWETSEGIDPYTYGYNRRTKDEEYRSVKTILHTLIDIVSKNGNYLLNLGPTAEGVIIKPMVDRLLEVGKWLKHSGECIYGTDYFFLGAESGPLRFTQTKDKFCIISLDRPQDGLLVVQKQVPVMEGDKITMLGGGREGVNLTWSIQDGGALVVHVPESVVDQVQWAWAFKVDYALTKG